MIYDYTLFKKKKIFFSNIFTFIVHRCYFLFGVKATRKKETCTPSSENPLQIRRVAHLLFLKTYIAQSQTLHPALDHV